MLFGQLKAAVKKCNVAAFDRSEKIKDLQKENDKQKKKVEEDKTRQLKAETNKLQQQMAALEQCKKKSVTLGGLLKGYIAYRFVSSALDLVLPNPVRGGEGLHVHIDMNDLPKDLQEAQQGIEQINDEWHKAGMEDNLISEDAIKQVAQAQEVAAQAKEFPEQAQELQQEYDQIGKEMGLEASEREQILERSQDHSSLGKNGLEANYEMEM